MKIRTQLIFSTAIFGVILIYIAVSLAYTSGTLNNIVRQQELTHNLERGVNELVYLSNDYLLFHESRQQTRWEAKFSAFANDLSIISPDITETETIVDNIKDSAARLQSVFVDAVAAFETARLKGAEVGPQSIQTSWSRIAVQNQGILFDTLALEQILDERAAQLRNTINTFVYILVGIFGLFLLSNYLLTYRRVIQSMSNLQKGTRIVATGNLDHVIEDKGKDTDEMGELARAFNHMTSSLKTITASKEELDREVAERKRMELELERVAAHRQLALDAARMGWWGYDPVTRITWFDDRYREIFQINGYEKPYDEILATRLHPEDLPGVWARVETALDPVDPQSYSAEYRINLPDGSIRWIEAYGIATFEGTGKERHATRLIGTVSDITARKQAEEELKQRTRELEVANKELEAFAYSVSHDLRAPLRGIDGFSNALLEDYHDKLDAQGKDYLKRVRDASQLMGELIDNMLELSRVSRAEMHLDEIDLSELAQSVADDLQKTQPLRKAAFIIMPGVTVTGDRMLITSLITNLLENAWKFTGKREQSRIEFGVTQQGDKSVYYVKDNGAGFDMRYADKLFKPFQRLHSHSDFPGTGIGLANVQRIIRRHGGSVWAESAPDKGATFYFTLG